MAWDVSTEWDDIHRRLGNFAPATVKVTLQQLTSEALDEAEQRDLLEDKDLEQLQQDEDLLDEQVLAKYRQRRLKEMQEDAKRPRFGTLTEINRQAYVREVNEAPPGVFVVLHLYQECVTLCRLLNTILKQLAKKFIHSKFIKIQATQCNEDFLDSDCPTLLVYLDGKLNKQLSRCAGALGGSRMTPEAVEWVLAENGVLETELEENPLEKKKTVVRRFREDYSDSDEDREYMSNQLPRYK